MECIFCKIDEKQVRYMMTKENICICDNCILLFSKKLSNQIKKDSMEIISNIKV